MIYSIYLLAVLGVAVTFPFGGFFKIGDTMEKEIWKDIAGYEGFYKVSSFGRVMRVKGFGCKKNKILKTTLNTFGYPHIRPCLNGKQKTITVHRLVITAFKPNPEDKRTINHIDGCKTNNHISNLEWATYSENLKHARDSGLNRQKGETHKCAKLTNADVERIMLLLQTSMTQQTIADMFQISTNTIHSIKFGGSWNHITGLPKRSKK